MAGQQPFMCYCSVAAFQVRSKLVKYRFAGLEHGDGYSLKGTKTQSTQSLQHFWPPLVSSSFW